MHRNITLRAAIIANIRQRMTDQGFMEFQTPILTASSPEGARDFLVPSRMHPGKFYALPQAPQQFKQLVMAYAPLFGVARAALIVLGPAGSRTESCDTEPGRSPASEVESRHGTCTSACYPAVYAG